MLFVYFFLKLKEVKIWAVYKADYTLRYHNQPVSIDSLYYAPYRLFAVLVIDVGNGLSWAKSPWVVQQWLMSTQPKQNTNEHIMLSDSSAWWTMSDGMWLASQELEPWYSEFWAHISKTTIFPLRSPTPHLHRSAHRANVPQLLKSKFILSLWQELVAGIDSHFFSHPACGTPFDVTVLDECFAYRGEKNNCDLTEQRKTFFEIEYKGKVGWTTDE